MIGTYSLASFTTGGREGLGTRPRGTEKGAPLSLVAETENPTYPHGGVEDLGMRLCERLCTREVHARLEQVTHAALKHEKLLGDPPSSFFFCLFVCLHD